MKAELEKDWKKLIKHWHNENAATFYELSKKFTKKYPTNVSGWIALANSLWDYSRYPEAYNILLKARKIANKKDYHYIYHQFGHFYQEKGDLKRAEIWYHKAISEKATSQNHVFLGACLAKQGKYSDAKKLHKKSIKLNTQPPDEAYYNLGLISRAQCKYNEAREYFEQAIKIDPKYYLAKAAIKDLNEMRKILAN